ncbi:MAG: DUF2155 domain-containing protein [Pseudomonadota bacterium]
MRWALMLAALVAGPAVAQGTIGEIAPEDDPNGFVETIEPDPNVIVSPLTGEVITLDGPSAATPRVRVKAGTGAVLRWLDKVSGDVRDIELAPGEVQRLGRLDVALGECRYPEANASGDAYAWVDIRSVGREETDFSGWMLASSPALSALDHPRYDVWVIRCTTA